MSNELSYKLIESFRGKIETDNAAKNSMNASIHNDIIDLTMNWEEFRKINHSFSNVISGELKATNQKSSGRCWGFAGLNLFRIYLTRKHNLKNFEFSQSYFMFWDKLEKANYFLESIISTADKNWGSRIVMHLLTNPIQDGGQWDMWVNLINKYGVVPQTEMPESYQSSKSMQMNRLITLKLREFAKELRGLKQNRENEITIKNKKEDMISIVYKMLCINLGTPPRFFDWKIKNKENKFLKFKNLDPVKCYNVHVGLKLSNYVCLINCPMSNKKYNKIYTVAHLGNVVGGQDIKYLNVDIQIMKKASIDSIKDNNPVWFGCDVGKYFNRSLGVMDNKLFDFELFYGTKFKLNKRERLEYGESKMTHAMLFTGVDLNESGKSEKWRVENSWGTDIGDRGYHIMSDSWFDEFNYEVVVEKKYLDKSLVKLLDKEPPITLKPWDPMGALAR